MKAISKICIALIVLAGVAFAGTPHIVEVYFVKTVESTALEDFPFYAYDVHRMATPNDYVDENDPGTVWFASATLGYAAFNSGNFTGHDWVDGDTICVIGSHEEDAGLATHAGYYRLCSGTMDAGVTTQTFAPWDSLKPMEPGVATASRRTLNIKIPNPREHCSSGVYDVLGFWVIADTTASGLPGAYDVDLGFEPVNGVSGDTTTFSYDTDTMYYSGFAKSTYHSYYIVARPETTTTPGVIPGFSTHYMAANSNLYIFGVEEFDGAEQITFSLNAAPNPFTQNATISYSIAQSSFVTLTVYNAAGQLIETLVNETKPAGAHTIDYNGAALPSGVYFYTLQTDKEQLTGQIVKLH